jgi:hypothetical protein
VVGRFHLGRRGLLRDVDSVRLGGVAMEGTKVNHPALAHLEDAEAALISHIDRISRIPDDVSDEDLPDALPVIIAVLRSISRAAGALEGGAYARESDQLHLSS